MKNILITAICIVIAVTAYAAAGPYITVRHIKSGIEEMDSEKLSKHVDFPVLRENLHERINAYMTGEVGDMHMHDELASIAMGFMTNMANGLAEAYASPAGLASLSKGLPLLENDRQLYENSTSAIPDGEPFQDARYTYDSMDSFSARITDSNGDEIRFILTRNQLSWKLTDIDIPNPL